MDRAGSALPPHRLALERRGGAGLSYLYFDRCFTRELVELGRADAERAHDQILSLLGGACAVAA